MEGHTPVDYSDDQKQALILSMTALLTNKIKLLIANPQKNRLLAQNNQLVNLIELITEHLLPQYCVQNFSNSQKLNLMHNLIFLLSQKIQSVLTAGVIRTCIDQNWDLKGYKSVLIRILHELGVEDTKKIQEFFDKMIQSQNLQSQSCIKAISQFLKSRNREIEEDDLKNPVVSFQTTFNFVKQEIDRFREQNMSYTCFTVLHPWAYDLDLVDFKYVINKDQVQTVCNHLKQSFHAQVFWLSFFKSQLSVSADEFIEALKEVCILNHAKEYFEHHYAEYKAFMLKNHFVVSLAHHHSAIVGFVEELMEYIKSSRTFNVLHDQIRTKTVHRVKTDFIDESAIKKYKISDDPDFNVITKYDELFRCKVHNLTIEQVKTSLDLKRQSFEIKPLQKQTHNLYLKFTNVDTEELKDLEVKFDGNLAQFKVGEGDINHYIITNDKKLWESQFMILNNNGKFYIRDLGVVHTSRIKVSGQTALQLHQGSLLDLGKVVHYHVDKLLHVSEPSKESDSNFIVMRNTQPSYKLDDEALFRARPTWISQDENKDLVQNEIMLEPTDKKSVFSVGRSNRRDVEIKLKAVSADHCKIEYRKEQGWFVHEQEKDRLSSNGTFVFMKSHQQMDDHEPSDIIPLFNGMIISFINYELQVRIEPKSQEELAKAVFEHVELDVKASQKQKTVVAHEEPVHHVEEVHTPKRQESESHSVYDEHLEATHNQKQNPTFIEEHQSQASQRSLNKSQPSEKSLHQSSVKSLHQSHHTQQEQEQAPDEGEESTQKLPVNQSVHDEQASVKSHHTLPEQQQEEEEEKQSVHEPERLPSARSERQLEASQSQRSVKQSVYDEQQEAQSHHHESVHQQSAHSLHQSQVEEPEVFQQQESHRSLHQEAQSQHHQSQASLKEPSVHASVHENSPKQSVHAQREEEEKALMRSYSQHHIGEDQQKSIIVQEQEHQEVSHDDQHEAHEQQEEAKSVAAQSHRSQKSLHEAQSHHEQSHHSIHQSQHEHQQEQDQLHQPSVHSEHPHNQSHHEAASNHAASQQNLKSVHEDVYDEPEAQNSHVHNEQEAQSHHNQSVHQEQEAESHHNQSVHQEQDAQSVKSHRSQASQQQQHHTEHEPSQTHQEHHDTHPHHEEEKNHTESQRSIVQTEPHNQTPKKVEQDTHHHEESKHATSQVNETHHIQETEPIQNQTNELTTPHEQSQEHHQTEAHQIHATHASQHNEQSQHQDEQH